MPEQTLRDCHILVVEDEYMLANELRIELGDAGAIVLGPVGTLEGALTMIEAEPHIDGAVVDVNLCGDLAYPAADLLAQRQVPFVFTTGYDQGMIPPRFKHIPRCEKPVDMAKVARAIGRAMHQ
jgi:hypothetical protein